MQLRITHQTRYRYTPPVQHAQHMAWLQPITTPWQQLQEFSLEVDPAPASQHVSTNVFGNQRCHFSLEQPHSELLVTARSLVQTTPPPIRYSHASCAQVRDQFAYRAGQQFSQAAEFLYPSPYVARDDAFARYAASSLAPDRCLFEACIELTARMHADFRYAPDSTSLHTPALTALEQRCGVCQDFAHIMLSCLRGFGLAARYVSGYLLTSPPPGQPRLIGADASHAWVSVFLPDAHGEQVLDVAGVQQHGLWCDFDPTNNRFGWGTPGEDYVTVAIGRDFGDVTPLRGVLHGGGQGHTLEVGVTVEPA